MNQGKFVSPDYGLATRSPCTLILLQPITPKYIMNLIFSPRSLLLGLSCLCVASLQAQSIVYQENWSGYANGASVIDDGYRFSNTIAPEGQPARDNSAIVHHDSNGSYLSLISYGYANVGSNNPGWSPKVHTTHISTGSPIHISTTEKTVMSVDIRYRTPGFETKGTSQPYSSFRFTGDGGNAFWLGFISPTRLFINFPGQNQVLFDLSTPINMDAWHRFAVELNPANGSMVLTVSELDALGEGTELWSTTSTSTRNFSMITTYTMELVRPGTSTDNVWSADFTNITISTIPEPAAVTSLLGGAALLLSLSVRTVRRRRAGAARS